MNKKSVVAIVAHDVGGHGGMERHLEEVIMRLKEDAHVIVVAASMKLPDTEGITFIRIPVIARPIPLKMILFAILASIRLLFLKYDILHTTGAIVWNRSELSTVHFCNAGFRKATANRFAHDHRSRLHRLNTSIASAISLYMEKFVYHPKRTKKLVAVSSRVKEELLDSFPYSDSEIVVIPNGVDTEAFHPYSSIEKTSMRKTLGLPEQGRFLLFMGGDWHLKGLEYVIQAFNEVAEKLSDIYLLVVGKGDKESYAKLVTPNLTGRVFFTGKQPNPQDWFGVSDVFVFPSSYETFSLVVHEAAAAGLTIVSTQVGGVEELIEHSKSGFFVERDVQQIVQTLLAVLQREDPQAYGEHARLRVKELNWHSTYSKLLKLYAKIMNEKTKPGSRGFEVERNHS